MQLVQGEVIREAFIDFEQGECVVVNYVSFSETVPARAGGDELPRFPIVLRTV